LALGESEKGASGRDRHVDAASRARARKALKAMLQSAHGVQLPTKWRTPTGGGMLRAFFGLCSAFAGLALAAVAGVALLFAHGPISLGSLEPAIARNLEQRFDKQYAFSLGPTLIGRSEHGLGLIFEGIEVKDRAGRVVLSAPSGRIGLDFLALLTLQVKVKRLEVDGIDMRLKVREDGALSLAAASAPDAVAFDIGSPRPATASGALPLPAMLSGLIEAVAGKTQPLDSLEVANGHLEIEDEKTHRTAAFEDVGVTFANSGGSARLRIAAKGPAGPWSLAAQARVGDGEGLTLEAHDLSLDDILLVSGRSAPFEADTPISFKLDMKTSDSAISAMSGRVSLGAGYFKLDDPDHEPFLIDEAGGNFRLDGASRRILVENFQLFAGQTHVPVSGYVSLPTADDETWGANFDGDGSIIAGERPGEQPLILDKATFQSRYLERERRFVIDRFAVSGAGANAALSGEAAVTPEGPAIKLKLDLRRTQTANVIRLWPSFIVADVRNWCIQHLHAGEIESGSINLDWDAAAFTAAREKRAVPPDSVHNEFVMKDATIDVMPGLPPLAGLDATGTINGRTVTLSGRHGTLELTPSRRISANEVFFTIPDTTPRALVAAQMGARLQGPADALADLMSRDALKAFVGLAIDPAATKGQFDGKIAVDLKLGKTATPDDIGFHTTGALSNLQVEKFLANERFDQGALTFSGDREGIKISGQGTISGMPARVEIDKSGAGEGSVDLSLTVDDAFRAKHGLDFGPSMSGPMDVQINGPVSRKGADVEIDLVHVALDNPVPGLVKAAGKPGNATFSIKSDAEGVAIGDIDIEAGGASIKGSARLSNDGAFAGARLTQVRLSPGDDMKVDISGSESLMKIAVRGAVVDVRPLLKGVLDYRSGASPGRDIDLDVKIASAIGANKRTMTQVEVVGSRRNGELQHVEGKGHLGASTATLSREAGTTHIVGSDAGALIKFFDLYGHLEGGTLDLVMHDVADGQGGFASVKDFVLQNEPALRQLVAAGQASDTAQTPDRSPPVDPDSARFERMTAQFVRTSGRIDLREAVIYNRQIGLTTNGFIDYAHDRLDLNGAYIPAYQVNSAITHIPVLGALLGGGAHEGMFGVNYRITGAASAPTLNVNPLSAMTPGFLRKIMGAIDGTTPPPQNAPAAAQ
jgi:Protein of unknown function/AsmA-like C-terminal region